MATRLVKGNQAVIIGALYAGCDCYFGYPITPASEVLQEAAEKFPLLARKFVQAESEEAAINMVYGAAAAGHRVLTASSGPGISLKQEGVSYLAGAELPAVIVNVMRAGPGLGNIGPEQSDYNQIVKGGGHGNYKCLVLAPNSVQEMCDLTAKAFDLAFKYRNPVYVLADGVIGQMIEPLKFPEQAKIPSIDSSWAIAANAETKENLVTSIQLDFDKLEEHNIKLQEKYASMKEDLEYEEYKTEDAEIIIVAYGIVSRIAKSAVEELRAMGIKAGMLRLITLFPFPNDRLLEMATSERKINFLVAELANGQMYDDVLLATKHLRPVELITRLGGNIMTQEQIIDKVKNIKKI